MEGDPGCACRHDDRMTKHLSPSFSGALRFFSFWVANGTVGYPLLKDVDDYRWILTETPSFLEQVYAIFANVIELDDDGNVSTPSTPNTSPLNTFGSS